MKLLWISLVISLLSFFSINTSASKENEQTKINIDLSTKKLTVQYEDEELTFPISIGTELSPTPVGHYTVIEKSKSWGGGFGSRWLGLDVSWGIYGIHGDRKSVV